ncbi:hypothetical protein PN419_04970 [Halorubrum ezzemoulense]|uniref:hypothetical protein n=1 Tax=Halorubrum TaxID=56688 RepID=UPI001E28C252|nr:MULTISPECIES: hypothetical protein [Halorubrum]MDB2223170.1 hypothetical protein [Halorubrum ezzemoulense]MDB2264624.1 hypothetical protein [Halorubrum ezzemoulense]MDB2271655.1 hypothetical protein [Halorubrum ezzemoulense]MDB2274904.1 hypothetical protein [Halorubrum ezzemoulense]MDB2280669.1 hypothetical protein [Halorubrum ezzemoulense]
MDDTSDMAKLGLVVNAVGLLLSAVGTLLLYAHVTDEYHSHIQDIGSIAVGYLGVILFGMSVSLTGIALLLRRSAD